MNTIRQLLQIVPQLPGQQEAVGDYAQTLALKLRTRIGCESSFVTGEMLSAKSSSFHDIILHYVNYGFEPRGVPKKLLSILRELRASRAGKLITVFHELYASAPPWRSAFWLRWQQKKIVREIAQLSDHCLVTNEVAREQLQQLAPAAHASVQPVFSNFGEPSLSSAQIAQRDPHRWAICGGTAAITQAVRSLVAKRHYIPDDIGPTHLHIIGGKEHDALRESIVDLAPITVDYRPQVAAEEASNVLRECSFAWFDYFHRANVPGPVILKSSAFAAACAHAAVPVFAQTVSRIADELPGPFSIDHFPTAQSRAALAGQYYSWYQHRASSDCLTNAIIPLLA